MAVRRARARVCAPASSTASMLRRYAFRALTISLLPLGKPLYSATTPSSVVLSKCLN